MIMKIIVATLAVSMAQNPKREDVQVAKMHVKLDSKRLMMKVKIKDKSPSSSLSRRSEKTLSKLHGSTGNDI